MEPEYIEEEDKINIEKIYSNAFAEKKVPQYKKKTGGLNEITELREKTAELLKISFEQVCGITRGWSKENLYTTLNQSLKFINPPALWWKIYNEKKNTYKQSRKKVLGKSREERRQSNQKEAGQKTLF